MTDVINKGLSYHQWIRFAIRVGWLVYNVKESTSSLNSNTYVLLLIKPFFKSPLNDQDPLIL